MQGQGAEVGRGDDEPGRKDILDEVEAAARATSADDGRGSVPTLAVGYGLVAAAARVLAAETGTDLAPLGGTDPVTVGASAPVATRPIASRGVEVPPVPVLPARRMAELPATTAARAILLPASAGPSAVLHHARAAGAGSAVYVASPGETAALADPRAAGAVVLARRVGVTVLEGGTADAVRRFGLARRHPALDVAAGTLAASPDGRADAWPLSGPRLLPPPRLPVPCRIVAEEPGDRYVVAVGEPPTHRLVDRRLVTAAGRGRGLIRCEVVARAGRLLTVDVPGVPLDDAVFAQLELDAWLEEFVAARAAAAAAAPVVPQCLAALPAPRPAPIAVLIASRNGSGSLADTIRSAVAQAEVYVVSDGSTDDTAAVAARAGACVLALEKNVGKPTALRTAIAHFGLTRRYDALAILDDDTLIEPAFVDRCRERLEPGVAIVVGKTMTRWTDDHRWNVWLGSRAYAYWRYQATLRRGQSALNVMTCISGSNSVYRSELLDQVLVEHTPYIVDDTYWTLETHRRKLGRIVYSPDATALICDPTNLRDWYKQNLRWMWGSFQGVWGHRVGRERSLFDFTYALQILDWLLYVLLAPLLVVLALSRGWVQPQTLVGVSLFGYGVGALVAAAVLRKWRLACMVPALLVIDWIYRFVFVHALVKTVRQPRVASCRWDSPARYT